MHNAFCFTAAQGHGLRSSLQSAGTAGTPAAYEMPGIYHARRFQMVVQLGTARFIRVLAPGRGQTNVVQRRRPLIAPT